MIEPRERLLWALVAVAVVGLLGLAVPLLGEAAPVLLGLVVLLVVVDFAWAGAPGRVLVSRRLPPQLVQGRAAELAVGLSSARDVEVEVTDSAPPTALADGADPDATHVVTVPAGADVVVATPRVLVRRGRHRLGRVAVRTLGPLGLVARRRRAPLDDTLRVIPDVALLAARAERLLRGKDLEGAARRRLHAEGRELDSLREYRPGDDPRLVEHKVSARRGALVVKKTRPETRQDVVVCLDLGRQLLGAEGGADGDADAGAPRLDSAVNAALTLAAAALSRGDRVGLCAFAADVTTWLPPAPARAQLRRLGDATAELAALAVESDYAAFARFLGARQPRRALVVVFTDVLDEPGARGLAHAVSLLRGRHVPVIVAAADPALARLAHPSVESASDPLAAHIPAAAETLLLHRKRGLAALAAAGARVVDAPASRAAALALRAFVDAKASGRW